MDSPVETKRIGDYKISIYTDENPDSPRNWDNLGTMVCFHNRYNLGDKHELNHRYYKGWDDMEAHIIKDNDVSVILPLFLYDHSGITMRTTSFHDQWDSGQIGFIYVSKKKIREEYSVRYVTKKMRERITGYLIAEVETYDQYLRGDVYGFVITKHGEEVDSCWGYYGTEVAMDKAESVVTYYIVKEKESIKEETV